MHSEKNRPVLIIIILSGAQLKLPLLGGMLALPIAEGLDGLENGHPGLLPGSMLSVKEFLARQCLDKACRARIAPAISFPAQASIVLAAFPLPDQSFTAAILNCRPCSRRSLFNSSVMFTLRPV
jgi:hypothetical protein